jgi:hypothetical protein
MAMNKTKRSKLRRAKQRGSALLVSLMVIVGLSLLGLGFVAISETEAAIAKNQQAVLQTQAVAEAGAKLVVEWFQDPQWALLHAALPSNDPAVNADIAKIKTTRVVVDGNGGYTGVYKPLADMRLFDKPYRTASENRLFGDENSADIIINSDTDPVVLGKFNDVLLGTSTEDRRDGEVVEIKVFAPPIVSGKLIAEPTGKLNADGTPQMFWSGGERYGVATIKVTSQMFRDRTMTKAAGKYQSQNILATHSVRLVVGELPLPIPAGPIQGNANVQFGGSFRVHWGMETSTGDLDPSGKWVSLPWANAYERPHFERGYEPGTALSQIVIVNPGSGYAAAPNVTLPAPAAGGIQATATATIASGSITAITITNRGKGYDGMPPAGNNAGGVLPPAVTIDAPPAGGTQATAYAVVGAEVWPPTLGQFDNVYYLKELIGKDYEDPWYGARAVQDNQTDGATPANTNYQCFTYSYNADEQPPVNANDTPSWAFQWQSVNNYPWQKKVLFPVINYDYWKKIAMQGRGYKGIYYFSYNKDTGLFYKNNSGTGQKMSYWANSKPAGGGLGAGFFFFDTVNGKNPQKLTGATRTAELTPDLSWQAVDFNGDFLMSGFVYMNSHQFGSTGAGNASNRVQANFPGEPYRDIGYPVWCTGVGVPMTNNCPAANAWSNCAGFPCRAGAGDGVFSYQELNGNGRFDAVVMASGTYNSFEPNATAHAGEYIPKTWKSIAQATADYGAPCVIPTAGYDGTTNAGNICSEPHEPYLNLVYPSQACCNNNRPNTVRAGWEAPGSQTYRPRTLDKTVDPWVPVTCGNSNRLSECTSNAYDVDGAVVPLDVILYGILYNEGAYNAQGNAAYYGSVLIQDQIGNNNNGTADVWFDEMLIKGTWAPPNMPRVIVFNEQTDEQQQ